MLFCDAPQQTFYTISNFATTCRHILLTRTLTVYYTPMTASLHVVAKL